MQQFNELNLNVMPTNDHRHWYLTVEEVAQGYGVTRNCVMNHLREHAEEIRDGIEKGVSNTDTPGGTQAKVVIYREGVIKLGFFVRSKQAVKFRQWATDVVCAVMDQRGIAMTDALQGINQRLDRIDATCKGMQTEIDTLKTMIGCVISESDEQELRTLVESVKHETGMDGRAIIGAVRRVLNVNKVYGSGSTRLVINALKNMRGEGLCLVPPLPVAPSTSN